MPRGITMEGGVSYIYHMYLFSETISILFYKFLKRCKENLLYEPYFVNKIRRLESFSSM